MGLSSCAARIREEHAPRGSLATLMVRSRRGRRADASGTRARGRWALGGRSRRSAWRARVWADARGGPRPCGSTRPTRHCGSTRTRRAGASTEQSIHSRLSQWPSTRARRVLAALLRLGGRSNAPQARTECWNGRAGLMSYSRSTIQTRLARECLPGLRERPASSQGNSEQPCPEARRSRHTDYFRRTVRLSVTPSRIRPCAMYPNARGSVITSSFVASGG